MEHPARRPMLALTTLTIAGALALTPISIAPPELHTPAISAARISTRAVQLSDAWSDLFTNTAHQCGQDRGDLRRDKQRLPADESDLYRAYRRATRDQPTYLRRAAVHRPGRPDPHRGRRSPLAVATIGNVIFGELPGAIVKQIQTPFQAAQLAIDSITTASNKLIALLEAPAVFLDATLNTTYGLMGINGPIAVPFLLRNLLANGLYTTPPGWCCRSRRRPPRSRHSKPAAAAVTPKVGHGIVDPVEAQGVGKQQPEDGIRQSK